MLNTVANEYNKLVSSIGAKGTNAYTTYERTVYMNDIPSSELEKWLDIEQERFSKLVLRLFHTGLETVYEEFNMSQDRDSRKLSYALMSGMLKKHPYGTQTTLGKAEHLKNPLMINYGIHSFYGVPREGQKMEEVKDLILGEIEKIKKGEFDEWLVEAVINDYRKDVYETVKNQDIDDLKVFFNQHIAHKKHCFLVAGNKKDVDMKVLKELGNVHELSLKEVFNF